MPKWEVSAAFTRLTRLGRFSVGGCTRYKHSVLQHAWYSTTDLIRRESARTQTTRNFHLTDVPGRATSFGNQKPCCT
jgi:hypothetical protein